MVAPSFTGSPPLTTLSRDPLTQVRGILDFKQGLVENGTDVVGLHAHNIEIRGGKLEVGSPERPWSELTDGKAYIELHGDVKVFGKGPPNNLYALDVYKRIDVRGYLGIFGEPRTAMLMLAEHVVPGATSFEVDGEPDWRLVCCLKWLKRHVVPLGGWARIVWPRLSAWSPFRHETRMCTHRSAAVGASVFHPC